MVAAVRSGVLETTNTTTTGAYVLLGASAGYRGWGSPQNGQEWHYVVRTATQFEAGVGTYTDSTRQLSRTLIVANHLGTTNPVSWGTGTKEVANAVIGERATMTDVENVWRANQLMRGNAIWFDSDDDTGIISPNDDVLTVKAAGADFAVFDQPNSAFKVISSDPGSGLNPIVQLVRQSISPAVNDGLARIDFYGRNSAAADIIYATLGATIESPTAGTANGILRTTVIRNGAVVGVMSQRGNAITAEPNVDFLTGAKSQQGSNTVGAEVTAGGRISAIVQDALCYIANRKGSFGTLFDWRKDDVSIGSVVSDNNGQLNYATFTGSHYSEWHHNVLDGEQFEATGTVVCTADGWMPESGNLNLERLSLARPSRKASDRSVYGVVAGRVAVRLGIEDRLVLMIAGLGTHGVRCEGPVAPGDLLETSATPGVARVQADDIVRASTLGKATQASPDDGTVRLVPAVLYAG